MRWWNKRERRPATHLCPLGGVALGNHVKMPGQQIRHVL